MSRRKLSPNVSYYRRKHCGANSRACCRPLETASRQPAPRRIILDGVKTVASGLPATNFHSHFKRRAIVALESYLGRMKMPAWLGILESRAISICLIFCAHRFCSIDSKLDGQKGHNKLWTGNAFHPLATAFEPEKSIYDEGHFYGKLKRK